jgi:hydroxymethylglutaryl-CoA lyase
MKIVECPRDAMQGLEAFIPTLEKVRYLNQLLKVGFDTIDFGSFVSPKVIPQMRDTSEVVNALDFGKSATKLLAIVANTRGAFEACSHERISYLGFPLSISETFQQRNTNKSITEALNVVEEIKAACVKSNKKFVVYISMGFGNPYDDPYDVDLVLGFVDVLNTLGADVISIADTIGAATPEEITYLFTTVLEQFPTLEIGAHLHATPDMAVQKIDAAFKSGCKRFDGAIRGFGGCPMANNDLVGNLATEKILEYLSHHGINPNLNAAELENALMIADEIFPKH